MRFWTMSSGSHVGVCRSFSATNNTQKQNKAAMTTTLIMGQNQSRCHIHNQHQECMCKEHVDNRGCDVTWHRRQDHVPWPLDFIKFAEDDIEPGQREERVSTRCCCVWYKQLWKTEKLLISDFRAVKQLTYHHPQSLHPEIHREVNVNKTQGW